jgi:hypothetical protein
MMQNWGAGWLFSELREKLAERVFELLYGTRELHCECVLSHEIFAELSNVYKSHFTEPSLTFGCSSLAAPTLFKRDEHARTD